MKDQNLLQVADEYATLFKQLGYSIAFGRIFGYLIASDPPYRSFDELVSHLKLSKGAVSTVLRTMQEHGYVDYFVRNGQRKRNFHICMRKWRQGLEHKIDDSIRFTRLLSETLKACNPQHREHCSNIRQLIAFENM